jgi:predicted Zn-dependent peptidase
MHRISQHMTTLPGGLRVVGVEMPHIHSVEIALYFKVGSRDDPPGKEGLSHFLEHVLFRGTSDYPSSLQLESAFENIGGSVNAATDAETTCYYSRVHPDHLEEGIRLHAAMALRPLLAEVEGERRVIVEEALEDLNERGEEINTDNLANRLLWPEHPLGSPTVGTLDSIRGITNADIRTHFETFYRPENAILAVAGAVDHRRLFAAAREAFAGWSGGITRDFRHAPEAQDEARLLVVRDPDSQVDLQAAFRGFPLRDERLTATRLIRRILTGTGTSRLHLELREKMGIVYSVDAGISFYEDAGSFGIELSTAPGNLVAAATTVLRETARLATEPVAEEELGRVRRSYLYDLDYTLDSAYEMQVRYGWGELMGMARDVAADRRDAETITSSDIISAARRLFAPERLNLVAVGPVERKARGELDRLLAEYRERFPK